MLAARCTAFRLRLILSHYRSSAGGDHRCSAAGCKKNALRHGVDETSPEGLYGG